MSMNEAKTKFLEGQKKYSEILKKKRKLEIRQSGLREKLKELEGACAGNPSRREGLIEALALDAITEKEFNSAMKGIVAAETERAQTAEMAAAVSQCLVDCSNNLTATHQENNELSCRFYLSLCEELTREIRPKIPTMSLRMLAYARLRSGRVYGSDGWANLLIDLFGNGRDTVEDLKSAAGEIKKVYGV